jgi:archaellum component FlaC
MSDERIEKEIGRLRDELEEARRRVPRHGATPQQILAVEELEERIAELERRLCEAPTS